MGLGMMTAGLNQTIVATALPVIVDDLDGLRQYTAVLSVYLIAATVTIPLYGRLSDLHGRRPLLAVALVAFVAGCIVGGTATSMTTLLAGRTLQGIGAGGMLPLALATIADVVPPAERGRWQGIVGTFWGGAVVAGPILGGVIAEHLGWRWVLLLGVPLALTALALIGAAGRLPAAAASGARIDWLAAALLTAGLTAALLATLWTGSAVPLLTLGGAALAGFAWCERRAAEPLLPVALLHVPAFRWACVGMLAVGVTLYVAVAFLPLLWQARLGASPTGSGSALAPLFLAQMAMSLASGEALSRGGRHRAILVWGPVLMLVAYTALALVSADAPHAIGIGAAALLGAGTGLLMQNLITVGQNALAGAPLGAVTGVLHLARQFGGVVAVVVLAGTFHARLAGELAQRGIDDAGGAPLSLADAGVRAATSAALTPTLLLALPLAGTALVAVLAMPAITRASRAAARP